MSFLVSCPYCGPRDVGEFGFGGEKLSRPSDPDRLSAAEWAHYAYDRENVDGLQIEWWYHRMGCRRFIKVERHTDTNQTRQASPYGAAARAGAGA